MANPEHLALLKDKGVSAWNEWRRDNAGLTPHLSNADLNRANLNGPDLSQADLSQADLSQADLNGADLSQADLNGANLIWANLIEADLSGANLSMADLSGANLSMANLGRADLSGANFSRANLSSADFSRADLSRAKLILADLSLVNLSGADLNEAQVGLTTFGDVDLSQVKNLKTVQHRGPSSIGIDTFYRSDGKIPDAFLRGCGVPETFITYARSLVGQAIEFYSCFISYSHQDQAMAERLHADLQVRGLRVWFAPEDLKIGDRFQERIEESIRLYDKVMIVLSDASVQSRWVEREVNAAREREDRESRTVLFPIRIDEAVMKAQQPWAADIRRSRHIGDFSRWKDHDAYTKAFERLLRDLRQGEATAATPAS
jgi:hypothetical protein